MLAQVYGPVLGVGMAHQLEDALQRSPKLHGFRGRVGERRVVHGVPRMVAEESGLALAFFFHRGW